MQVPRYMPGEGITHSEFQPAAAQTGHSAWVRAMCTRAQRAGGWPYTTRAQGLLPCDIATFTPPLPSSLPPHMREFASGTCRRASTPPPRSGHTQCAVHRFKGDSRRVVQRVREGQGSSTVGATQQEGSQLGSSTTFISLSVLTLCTHSASLSSQFLKDATCKAKHECTHLS